LDECRRNQLLDDVGPVWAHPYPYVRQIGQTTNVSKLAEPQSSVQMEQGKFSTGPKERWISKTGTGMRRVRVDVRVFGWRAILFNEKKYKNDLNGSLTARSFQDHLDGTAFLHAPGANIQRSNDIPPTPEIPVGRLRCSDALPHDCVGRDCWPCQAVEARSPCHRRFHCGWLAIQIQFRRSSARECHASHGLGAGAPPAHPEGIEDLLRQIFAQIMADLSGAELDSRNDVIRVGGETMIGRTVETSMMNAMVCKPLV
jgi:hypothetical protein